MNLTPWLEKTERAARKIEETAAQADKDEAFVHASFMLLRDEGFFKVHVPSDLGGHGVSYGELCTIVRRLGRACGSTALAFSMHCHLVAVAAWRLQHEKAPTDGLLRRVASENLMLVSSGGSDWLKGSGEAVKVDGGYRVTARKIFSSGSPMGDLLVTSAVHQDPQAGPTVLHFAVPFKAEGVKRLDTWHVMGMRGTGSHDVELNNAFVPDGAISGRRPQGKWHPLFHAISMLAFPLIYSAYMGIADGARSKAIGAASRKPDDGQTCLIAGELENAHAAGDMALAAMIHIAETRKPSPETTSHSMIRRTLVEQAAITTVERAMMLAGGASFYTGFGLERAFRDIQAARFHPLQEKAQLRYSGRHALGFDIDG